MGGKGRIGGTGEPGGTIAPLIAVPSCPSSQSRLSCPKLSCSSIGRVRAVRLRSSRSDRAGYPRARGRSRAGRTRWRSSLILRQDRRRRRVEPHWHRAPQPSAAGREIGRRRRTFHRRPRAAARVAVLRGPGRRDRPARSASGARSRTRRAPRVTIFSTAPVCASMPTLSRSAIPATTGRDGAASPPSRRRAARVCPACTRRTASSFARCLTAAVRSCAHCSRTDPSPSSTTNPIRT